MGLIVKLKIRTIPIINSKAPIKYLTIRFVPSRLKSDFVLNTCVMPLKIIKIAKMTNIEIIVAAEYTKSMIERIIIIMPEIILKCFTLKKTIKNQI
jgi:hypothetical protein